MIPLDLIGTGLSLLLTLAVFSYIIGDNPIFRIVVHIFIGAAAGYVLVITIYNVLIPRLILPLLSGTGGERALAVLPLLLGLMLLTKVSPRIAWIGNAPMAYLVGIGAATAIGGSVLGTIFPQVNSSISVFDATQLNLLDAIIVLVGTISTLVYFHFGARPGQDGKPQRSRLIEGVGIIGQVFIAITFGTLFAGVYMAALTALIERLYSSWTFLQTLITGI